MVSANGLCEAPVAPADAGVRDMEEAVDFADAFVPAEDFDFVPASARPFFAALPFVFFREDAPAGSFFLDFGAVFAVLVLDLAMDDLRIQVRVDSEN